MIRNALILLALLLLGLSTACGPTDKRVLFVSDRDGSMAVYSVASDGSDVAGLPGNGLDNTNPQWSHDRDRLALIAHANDSAQLQILAREDDSWKSCTLEQEPVVDFAWDPSGTRIAFLTGSDRDMSVYAANADCSGAVQVTYGGGEMRLGNWSEDSQWVAFSIVSGDDQGVFLRNPSGVDRKRVSPRVAERLAWAPQGGALAFLSTDDEVPRIYALEDINAAAVSLTNQVQADSSFAWSPDGKRIAFVSDRDGDSEIYIMKADGSEQQRLTNNEIDDTLPAWSSNGKRIVFVSDLHGNGELFVMDDDGANQRRLTSNESLDTSPSW